MNSACLVGGGKYRLNAAGGGCGGGTACNSQGQVSGSCNNCPCGTCTGAGGGGSCSWVDSRCLTGGGKYRLNAAGGGCGGGTACNSQGQVSGSCNDCPCGSC
ncbi:hypothetical protein HYX06_03105 [Candidatus Woesearchaeota archaeon]|nr:hypothetical protein [Candidatus Woesearchaeota archaeon]